MLASEIVNRALRIANIIAVGETARAEDSGEALSRLNDLLKEWRGSNIMVPDYDIATLPTAMSLDPADKDAVAYQLAMRMGPDYGWEPTQLQAKAADESFSRLRLRYWVSLPTDYSHMPPTRDICNDPYNG